MIWLFVILIATLVYFIPNKKPYAGVYTRPGVNLINLSLPYFTYILLDIKIRIHFLDF